MYKEFYGFTTYPFALTPDPQFLYLSTTHEKCLRSLSYSLERGHGLIALTGIIGTGKTFILKVLLQSLEENTHKAYLGYSKLEFIDILKCISQAFGLEGAGKTHIELLLNLKKFLFRCEKMHEKVLVIIDEAQGLSVDVLEDLVLLTNFETHEKKLLQIILVGQPQLRNILKFPQLIPLAQRVVLNCHLLPLNDSETKGYIEKKLEVAGAMYPVFTSRAIHEICVASQGIPRVINLICERALLCGARDEKRQIGHAIIQQVMQDMHFYTPEKFPPHSHHKRDEQGPHTRGDLSHRDATPLESSGASRGPEGMEQGEQCQSQRDSWGRGRSALAVGLTSVSLLAAGFVLQSSWTSGKLREYTVHSVARSRTLLPHNPSVREPPLLPHSPGVRALSHRVQWVQPTVFYQFLPGKPLTVSLPHLQRTPEAFPVRVTLDVSDRTPRWLNFDAEKLALSGTAPPQEAGKTYHLTLRAHTADGLASLLHCIISIRYKYNT